MDKNTQWLLEGDPWVAYRARLTLLNQSHEQPEVDGAKRAMLAHPQILDLICELQNWPGNVLTSHKSAGHLIHKLTFAADIGLTKADPGMDSVISRILEHHDTAGPMQVLMNIPVHFGGTGSDQWAWTLCDTPLILYALVKFGLANHPQVQAGVQHLITLVRDNGWPCAGSTELGKFRGPGRKDDPCPYANLLILKLLAELPDLKDDVASHTGAEAILSTWQEREQRHPYMFYMGTDFCKLKTPLVWYDILHVTLVLSHFEWLKQDARLLEMAEIIKSKVDEGGRFTPESIWTAWKDWEFGQKKVPSRWLTLIADSILATCFPTQ